MSDESQQKKQVLDITSLDTYDLLSFFIDILGTQAWQHMGLRVRTGTDKTEKDFERARVAIDCISFMIDKLETHANDQERDSLRKLLADLQINFARVTLEK